MFEKVLIANRGEIALRVARACRELGVKSVAIYSTADAESAVVRFADEAVCVGPPAVGKSYLHIPNIIGACQKVGADALHPGYGFLSEDPFFAEICADNDITFIGPKPEVMERVGDKAIARDLMQKAGLPLLPGTIEPVATAGRGPGDRRLDRLPGDHQGRRRRRRTRDERGAQERGPRAPLRDHPRHGAGDLQGQRGLHRALPRRAAPHRGAAGLRQPGQRRLLLRARLLRAAPPPEADRGGARRSTCPTMPGATSASARWRGRSRSATRAPGRWSSCSTTTAT